jgi:hypothetical protein
MAEVKKVSKEVKTLFYDETYSEKGKVKETNRTPQVNFVFKPLNMIQTAQLADKVSKTETVEGATICNLRLLKDHIIEWDLKKADGTVISTDDIEALKKVSPRVMQKIINAIRGDNSDATEDLSLVESELKN